MNNKYVLILKKIDVAKKDLEKLLLYANVKTIEEFYEKSDSIKNKSYHTYNDVIDHLNYMEKLKKLKEGK